MAPGATIRTVVGADLGHGPGTSVDQSPSALARRGDTLYVGDDTWGVIRVLDLVTGDEQILTDSDGAEIAPGGLAATSAGELFISDGINHKVYKLDATGHLTTVAGTGVAGGAPVEGGRATDASLTSPAGLAVDNAGNLYIAESGAMRVRKVDLLGTITTVAGNGIRDYSGDGGPAKLAALDVPFAVAVDAKGQVFIGDARRVRMVNASGIITTVAGNGQSGFAGDGGPATAAPLWSGYPITLDAAGDLFIGASNRVRKVAPSGTITTVAGTTFGSDSETGLATDIRVGRVTGLDVDDSGNIFIGDGDLRRVRKVDPAGQISTLAGFLGSGMPGDGGPAAEAQSYNAAQLSTDLLGNLYLSYQNDVRRIDTSGTIETVVGDGHNRGLTGGDGGPATQAQLALIGGTAVDLEGTMYVTDAWGVRRVNPDGIIERIAGRYGVNGFGGDGGPATAATMDRPGGIAVDAVGNVYVADMGNSRVRRIDTSGVITTVAGTSQAGFSGDGRAATSAQLNLPHSVAVSRVGDLYISDSQNRRIRKVDAAGTITTVLAFAGGPGEYIGQVALDGADTVFTTVGDPTAQRVVRLTPSGPVVVAGNGTRGMDGDGGPAVEAQMDPIGITIDRWGTLFISDIMNRRIRAVVGAGAPAPVISSCGFNGQGELGAGMTADRRTPVRTVNVAGQHGIATGAFHSALIGGDGAVWTWGWNIFGQLGTGSTTDQSTPAKVAGVDNVTEVAAGAYHTLALRSDGTVWAWGLNAFGEVGDGTTVERHAPVRVQGLDHVVGIATGAFHSLAVLDDGTVRSWGYNHFGQLGDGSTLDHHSPVTARLSGVESLAAGAYHSLSLQRDGSVQSWGWNALGQLGDGTTVDRSVAAPVAGLNGVEALGLGAYYHVVALKGDGTVWTWGWNLTGQIGDGTVNNVRPTPTQVPGLGDVVSLAGGGLHNVAVQSTGVARAWGWNAYGQLADRTLTDRPSPVRVWLVPGASVTAGLAHTTVSAPG